MTNIMIENVRFTGKGAYLPNYGETSFSSLRDVELWVLSQGYTIAKCEQVVRNGWVYTSCGMLISTNGYVCKRITG